MRAIHDESCEPLHLWLKIAGRWLTHDVGFHAGQKLLVHVEHGELIITAAQIAPVGTQSEQITISPDRRQPC
ncbi:type I addiction module toxin, SymE family [Burkholderia sp. Bp9143]|uniref:SymE family type I addiction module toxin n=1 Tax=Burkholderia sp. Bp9143 TaxID=2184574 RepID=UPI000F590DC2|nr:SymE family type I addiction module toxin [Burkholderia sp. Bp9143]RQR30331.1 type I addiction module toxin, SymE family [Burkholderia sp. Bp9143]